MVKSSIEISIGVKESDVKARLAAIGKAVKDLGLMTESAFAKKNMGVLGVKPFADVKAEMAGLTKAYRDLSTSGQASTADLSRALEALRTKQQALYATISQPPKLEAARSTLGITSHKELAAEIGKVKRAYAELAASGKLSMAELAQAKVAVGRKLDELKNKTNGWRDALAESKGKFIEAAAAGAGMVLASKAAIDFESAMAKVSKTVGGTPTEMAKLGDELLNLSRTIPLTAIELASIAAAGGQLGIAANEIKPFVEVTAKMATAFDMTADEAGTAIGKLKNVFSLSIPEITTFGDAINQLGNTSAAREKDIVDVMLRVGGTSRQFGLAKEQTAALAAAMLSLGKPPEVAATSINSLLNRMQTATMQSGDFMEALDKIGMSAEQMAESVANDPQKAIETLLETLAKLDGRERSEVLTGLFGREFQDDIAVLVGGLQTYKDALKQVADKTSFAGAMQKEFTVQSSTTANKLKTVGSVIWEIGNNIGEGFLGPIKAAAAGAKALLTPIADLTAAFPKLSAGLVFFATGAAMIPALTGGFKILQMAVAGLGVGATGVFATISTAALGLTGTLAMVAARTTLLGGTFAAAYGAGALASNYLRDKLTGITAAQEELTRNTAKTASGFREVSASTGITITSMKQLDQAVKDGKIYYDDLTGTWVKGAKEQAAASTTTAATMKKVTGEALEAMKKKYQEYASEIRKLQEEIAGRERSLYAELREMGRTGMSEYSAWKDQKKEAEEYAAAAKKAAAEAWAAFAAGDTITGEQKFKEAVQYADDAKKSYKDLNTEVKDGEKVVVSQAEALKTSMEGVQSAGELGIEILKKQQEAVKNTMDVVGAKSMGADLTAGMDDAEKKWLANWRNMKDFAGDQVEYVKKRIDGMVEDRYVTVWVTEKVRKATGGLIHRLARGGRLPGYGGGDRISALLEAGEFVIRKEAVAKFGSGLFHALNSLQLPEIPRFATGGPVGFSSGGQVLGGETMTINLNFGPGRSVPVQAAAIDAARLKKEFARMDRLRSA